MKRDFKIDDIKIPEDVALMVRLRNPSFARTLLWLSIKYENQDFIYTSELSNFLKKTNSYAGSLLGDFVKFNLLKKEPVSANLVMWKPMSNSKEIILNKYVEVAKKTLGIGK